MRWAWLAVVPFLFQQQTQGSRPNWPCGANIDPAYFALAEATGGSMALVAPWEIADPGSLEMLVAPDRHSQIPAAHDTMTRSQETKRSGVTFADSSSTMTS